MRPNYSVWDDVDRAAGRAPSWARMRKGRIMNWIIARADSCGDGDVQLFAKRVDAEKFAMGRASTYGGEYLLAQVVARIERQVAVRVVECDDGE